MKGGVGAHLHAPLALQASPLPRLLQLATQQGDAVAALAADSGFGTPEIVEMPANNLSVMFRRPTAP
mgnify:CR=1 FL=1